LAGKTAAYIVKNDPSADYEVLEYGYDILFQEISVTILTLLLALPFGLFVHVAISLATYNVLRLYAGGLHAKHRIVCIVTSIVIMFGPSVLFAKLGVSLPIAAILALYLLNLVLLLLYAPADTEAKPIQDRQTRKRMKMASVSWLTIIYCLALILHGRFPDYSAVLAAMPFIVCCFAHPLAYWLYGCKKSKKTEVLT
jgi:accessory gene regulator B